MESREMKVPYLSEVATNTDKLKVPKITWKNHVDPVDTMFSKCESSADLAKDNVNSSIISDFVIPSFIFALNLPNYTHLVY